MTAAWSENLYCREAKGHAHSAVLWDIWQHLVLDAHQDRTHRRTLAYYSRTYVCMRMAVCTCRGRTCFWSWNLGAFLCVECRSLHPSRTYTYICLHTYVPMGKCVCVYVYVYMYIYVYMGKRYAHCMSWKQHPRDFCADFRDGFFVLVFVALLDSDRRNVIYIYIYIYIHIHIYGFFVPVFVALPCGNRSCFFA